MGLEGVFFVGVVGRLGSGSGVGCIENEGSEDEEFSRSCCGLCGEEIGGGEVSDGEVRSGEVYGEGLYGGEMFSGEVCDGKKCDIEA